MGLAAAAAVVLGLSAVREAALGPLPPGARPWDLTEVDRHARWEPPACPAGECAAVAGLPERP